MHVDPTLEAGYDELAAQHEVATRLRDLVSVANEGLRALDVLRSEIEARRESAELLDLDVPEEAATARGDLAEGLQTAAEELTRPEGKTFWSQGPRLADHLQSLSSDVDSNAFGAPTAAQLSHLEELEGRCDEVFATLNEFFAEKVPELNTLLSEHGLPGLSVPAPLEWEPTPEVEGGAGSRGVGAPLR